VLIVGIIIYFILLVSSFNLFLKRFFSDIFYIFWFSGWPFSYSTKSWGAISSYELSWVEFLGPRGLIYITSNIRVVFTSFEFLAYKITYIFIGIFFIVFIFILFF
jgi:hypothetical protein